jgi:hypothetical protein
MRVRSFLCVCSHYPKLNPLFPRRLLPWPNAANGEGLSFFVYYYDWMNNWAMAKVR